MEILLFAGFSYIFTLLAWPVSNKLFHNMPDRSWGVSRVFGLAMYAWVVWSLASYKIVVLSITNIWVILILMFVAIWGWFFKFNLKECFNEISNIGRLFVGSQTKNYYVILFEMIFFLCFFSWLWVRSHNPMINGIEKFMDYSFIISTVKSDYLPPLDPSFARETINYYYYGQYLVGLVFKLLNIAPDQGYNIFMSWLFASSVAVSFSIGCYLARLVKLSTASTYSAGLLSAVFVNLMGNSHYLFFGLCKTLNQYFGINLPLGIDISKMYWYPDATRFIPFTIHEFPVYSFAINDCHAHIINILNVQIVFTLILSLFIKVFKKTFSISHLLKHWVVLSWMIGLLYVSNAWDFAIYALFFGMCFWTYFAFINRFNSWNSYLHVLTLSRCVVLSIATTIVAVIGFLTFWVAFHSPAKGIGLVPVGGSSAWHNFIVLWLFQIVIAGVYFFVFYHDQRTHKDMMLTKTNTSEKALGHRFIKLTLLMVLLLFTIPEFIYVKDIYESHYRSNTMFKLVFQAWIMMGLVTGPIFLYVHEHLKNGRRFPRFVFGVLCASIIFFGLRYSCAAIFDASNLANKNRSLDGMAFMKQSNPDDFKAIEWINNNIPGQPTIVEGVGESFTYSTRIASFTGLPTVIGWPVHEWLWRGSYADPVMPVSKVQKKTLVSDSVGSRVDAVKNFYTTGDIGVARKFLKTYEVEFIFLGMFEFEKYPNLNAAKFEQLGTVVFQSGTTKIFRVLDSILNDKSM